MHKRGICRHAVSVCQSVCLSRSWVASKRIKISSNFFPYRTGWRYSDGNPPNESVECKGVWKKIPFDRSHTSFYWHSIVTTNYSPVLYNFREEARYWSKFENQDFFYTLAFDAPVRGSPSEYWHPVRYGKTRMVSLPDGEKHLHGMFSSFDRIPTCDRQTEGRTDILPRHSPRYAYVSRSNNR